jgi:hypothetical protein
VLKRIARSVQDNYWRIYSPLDLAVIIVENCAGNTTDLNPENGEVENFNYLDWFYLSIKQVVTRIPSLYREVRKAHNSRWLLKRTFSKHFFQILNKWRRLPKKWTSRWKTGATTQTTYGQTTRHGRRNSKNFNVI